MKNSCLLGSIVNQLEYVPSIFIKNQVLNILNNYNIRKKRFMIIIIPIITWSLVELKI